MATISCASSNINNDGNTLILYHHEQSFYSQKVVFALVEKRLPFQSQIVQLPKFEQYEPWFIRMNPKGEVPVLRDGVKVIPDSSRIIEYLEDNFSNGDTPRLFPEKGSDESHKFKYFRDIIDEIPIEDMTVGCLLHPEFTQDTKFPKFVRDRMRALRVRRFSVIQEKMVSYPDLKELYERKLMAIQDRRRKQESRQELTKILDNITRILDDVEIELLTRSTEENEKWLTGEKFTAVDISLSVLLNRIFILGLSHRWWGEDRRPHLASYFEKVRKLESFKRACLTVSSYDKLLYVVEMLKLKVPMLIGAVALVTTLAFGIFMLKKLKK